MSGKKDLLTGRAPREPYRIVRERLNGTNTELTSFSFHQGANVYALSYEKEGIKRHTLVDAGDSRYQNEILPILIENDINPANIERIIITHHHRDHCGLANLLAKESKAKILVHSNFRGFVEGEISQEERRWLGSFNPTKLKECDIEYLPQPDRCEVSNISGMDFPILAESIEIGEAGKLMILACPSSTPTHSPDQIIVFYSPRGCPLTHEKGHEDFRPTDGILFSGDLWLMRGPLDDRDFRSLSRRLRYNFYRMKRSVSDRSTFRRDPREQDSQAKESLKRGFPLIRVAPGHGGEFIGSRIIPNGLLADRDILVELGYPSDANKSLLTQRESAPRIATLLDQAYTNFTKELLFWIELDALKAVLGLVEEFHFDEEHHHYEMKPSTEHHHLTCLGCGKVVEFKCPLSQKMKEDVSQEKGFEVTDIEVWMRGYCPDCLQKRK